MKKRQIMPLFFVIMLVALFVGYRGLGRPEKQAQQTPPYPMDATECVRLAFGDVKVPGDFSMSYSEGPTHAEWGPEHVVTLSADGSYSVKDITHSMEMGEDTVKILAEGMISLEAVRRIYLSILGCQFFELKQSYWNQDVMDGTRELMRVTADGKSHSVVTYYYIVRRFDSIKSTLLAEIS